MNWWGDDERRRREEEVRRRREDDERKRDRERQIRRRREDEKKKKLRRKKQAEKAAERKKTKAEKKKKLQLLMNESVGDILSGAAEKKLFGEATFDPDGYADSNNKVNRAAVYRTTWGQNATETYNNKQSDEADEIESGSKLSRGFGGRSQIAKFSPFHNSGRPVDPSKITPQVGPQSVEERLENAPKLGMNKLKRGGF